MPILRIAEFDWLTKGGHEIDTEYDVDDFDDACGFLAWDLEKTASPEWARVALTGFRLNNGNFSLKNGSSSRGVSFRYIP